MEAITLGDIGAALAFVVGLGGSVVAIVTAVKKAVKSALLPLEMAVCKNFIVQILSSAERGEKLTEMERMRLAEEYTIYISNKGNSYIKEWHEKLKNEGKL